MKRAINDNRYKFVMGELGLYAEEGIVIMQILD